MFAFLSLSFGCRARFVGCACSVLHGPQGYDARYILSSLLLLKPTIIGLHLSQCLIWVCESLRRDFSSAFNADRNVRIN